MYNGIIDASMIDNMNTIVQNQSQRMAIPQVFFSNTDNTGTTGLPVIGDISTPGMVVWTMKMPFSLSTTTKAYTISFINGPVFNDIPTLSFAIQMDNANFGVQPIITNVTRNGAGITFKVISGQPSTTNLVNGQLHITAIGYH